jgi:hypothetical protein
MIPGEAKSAASAILDRFTGKPEASEMEDEVDVGEAGLDTASEEVMSAFEAKDPMALKVALRSFFDLCDSMPHKEGPHED